MGREGNIMDAYHPAPPTVRTTLSVALIRTAWLVGVSTLMVVAKAYITLPLPQRGIEGSGLYALLTEWQFIETAVFVCIATVVVARRRLELDWIRTALAAAGASAFGFGLMTLDARWQSYPENIENLISHTYGSPGEIFAIGWITAVLGLATIAVVAMWPHAATKKSA